jgi:hypothetical protein
LVPLPGQFCFNVGRDAGGPHLLESDWVVISWKKQGEAIVGGLTLVGGGKGNVVLVGSASNPKGATLISPGEDPTKPRTALLPAGCELLSPGDYLHILCMQERSFGERNLPEPGELG